MADAGFLEEQALKALREAAPGRDVGYAVRKKGMGRVAKASFADSRIVKYAYLGVLPGGELEFRAHPGDTLVQARQLYGNPHVVSELMALSSKGWNVLPNFHFGYMAKGLCWAHTRMPVAEYAEYWVKRIDQLGVIRRPDWKEEIAQLVKHGVLADEDLACFDEKFEQTERELAIPRPGLSIKRSWSQTDSLDASFADRVKEAFQLIERICAPSDQPLGPRVEIWTDGSHCGFGVVIKDEDGKTLRELAAAAPTDARDQSDTEYLAVIWALREVRSFRVTKVVVNSDSEFMVKQLTDRAKISDRMRKHYEEVRELSAGMNVSFEWIEGESNSRADRLSRQLCVEDRHPQADPVAD